MGHIALVYFNIRWDTLLHASALRGVQLKPVILFFLSIDNRTKFNFKSTKYLGDETRQRNLLREILNS